MSVLQSWEQQRVGVRAASGGGGAAGRAAPPTPPVDYMPLATGSSCAPQPVVNRENVYAPNPLNSPLSGLATLHAGGVPTSLSSFASPGSMGVGAASILTPGPRSALSRLLPPFQKYPLCLIVFLFFPRAVLCRGDSLRRTPPTPLPIPRRQRGSQARWI